MFRQMPVILALIIVIIISFGDYIPQALASLLFGISLSIKSLIIFLLPVIIFSLLYKATISLAKDASKIITIIFLGVIGSNFLTTTLSQMIGMWVYGFDISLIMPSKESTLPASDLFLLPSIIPNYLAMIGGIIAGVASTQMAPNLAINIGAKLERITGWLLQIVTLLIPIFVTGFVVKLQYDGIVMQIIKDYTVIFVIIASAQFGYIAFLYFALSGFRVKPAVSSITNMLPAAFSGFSTMSSAASMPLTIAGTEKNAKDKDIAHLVVPASVNIHLIGDCVAIPCFAFAILKNYDMVQPDLFAYFIFTCYFVLAKFSVAAIPGGGIIVMLPILEQYLGFNAEMLSLITALYILFDPVITSANVIGNGAFAKMIDLLLYKKAKYTKKLIHEELG
ncbi:MAG: transporter [Rickettsiales bacterium]|nr:MAG: transporter [Rickettsiales bacterium]